MYTGHILFDESGEDHIKKGRVDLQGNLLVFDWTTESKEFTGRLLGVAEKKGKNTFVSPWIHLMNPDGTANDDAGARLFITVDIPNSTEIVVSGEWEDFEGVKWPFSGRMEKCREIVTVKSITELNAIVTPETGWIVESGVSPADQSEFLRLFRPGSRGEKILVGVLPRESEPGVICAFGSVARHYYEFGLALASALHATGFEICEFGPDGDQCDCCNAPGLQLYFQGPEDAGRYYCADCVVAEHASNIASAEAIELQNDATNK